MRSTRRADAFDEPAKLEQRGPMQPPIISGYGYTPEQVARILKLSPTHVRDVERSALRKLRDGLAPLAAEMGLLRDAS